MIWYTSVEGGPSDMNTMGTVLRLLGIGWYVAVCVVGGGLCGVWIDGLFGLRPLFSLLGMGAGVFIALFGMYKMLMSVLWGNSKTRDKREE